MDVTNYQRGPGWVWYVFHQFHELHPLQPHPLQPTSLVSFETPGLQVYRLRGHAEIQAPLLQLTSQLFSGSEKS